MRAYHRIRLILSCILVTALIAVWCAPSTQAATSKPGWSNIEVAGKLSNWRVTVNQIRKLYAIPRSQSVWYKSNLWVFYVLNLKAENYGRRATSIYNDLYLSLKIMPRYQSAASIGAISGWTTLIRNSTFTTIYQAAQRDFGGALPWQVTSPRHETSYVYVIGARRGESHYGLYNLLPDKPEVFLLDTGY